MANKWKLIWSESWAEMSNYGFGVAINTLEK